MRQTILAAVALFAALAFAGCRQRPLGDEILVVEPGAASLHLVGTFDPGARTLRAAPGETGYLHYGPYVELAPGPLTADFALDAEGPEGEILGEVDINASTAAKPVEVIARADVHAEAGQVVSLEFDAVRGAKYEFRVRTTGAGKVTVRKITIARR